MQIFKMWKCLMFNSVYKSKIQQQVSEFLYSFILVEGKVHH